MKVTVTTERRFYRTPDAGVWTSGQCAYSFWTNYLSVFAGVSVVARVADVSRALPNWRRADGDGVQFAPLPYYVGPQQLLARWRTLRRECARAIRGSGAVISHVHSPIASCIIPLLVGESRPHALEVISDPNEMFRRGAVDHPLRPFIRHWSTRQLQRQCAAACAVSYVTEYTLQRRYPPGSGAFATGCSSVHLPAEAIALRPRTNFDLSGELTMITVGSLAQPYKGTDLLIKALGRCVAAGSRLRLVVIGDGKYRSQLEALTRSMGLQPDVRFVGELPAGEPVRRHLDEADLFVMPSRTEGLPRAMIEAMARGLPCVGSDVGGIPELLPSEDLVPVNRVSELAAKILEVTGDRKRLSLMSSRNLENARKYERETLRQRRTEFYGYVHEQTTRWQRRKLAA